MILWGSLSGKFCTAAVTTVGFAGKTLVGATDGVSATIEGDAKEKVGADSALDWSATDARKRRFRPAPGSSATLICVWLTATTRGSARLERPQCR